MSSYVAAARKTGSKQDGRRRKTDGPTACMTRRSSAGGPRPTTLPTSTWTIPQRIIEQFEADEEAKRNKAPAPDQLFSGS